MLLFLHSGSFYVRLNTRIALHKVKLHHSSFTNACRFLVAMTFSNPNKIMPIRSISLWMTAQGHGVYVSIGLEALIHHFDSFFWFLLITFVVIQVVETSIKLNRKHLTSLKCMFLSCYLFIRVVFLYFFFVCSGDQYASAYWFVRANSLFSDNEKTQGVLCACFHIHTTNSFFHTYRISLNVLTCLSAIWN